MSANKYFGALHPYQLGEYYGLQIFRSSAAVNVQIS